MNHSSYINHEVVFRLTQYIVPVAFGVIMAVGLVGNVLVISVVSVVTGVTCHASRGAGVPHAPDEEHDQPADPEPGRGGPPLPAGLRPRHRQRLRPHVLAVRAGVVQVRSFLKGHTSAFTVKTRHYNKHREI